MSDSHLINKIENLLKSKHFSIKDNCINITDTASKQLINFSLDPRRLDIYYPSPISSDDLDVNGGEIERLYKAVEWIKWKYVIDFLNDYAWKTVVYKPQEIDSAEKSLVHFVSSFNRVGDSQKGSWMKTTNRGWCATGRDSRTDGANLLWQRTTRGSAIAAPSNIEIKFNCFLGGRTESVKKFFRTTSKYITEENIAVNIKGIPNPGSSWGWNFTHQNENRDALLEAIKTRQKAIVNYNLSSLTV